MNNFKFTTLLFRLLLGFLYLSAGLSKSGEHTFGNIIGPVWMDKIADEMGMPVWPFHLITLFQIITGVLLLSRKYYRVGILMVFPLSIGILIFTLGWGSTFALNFLFLIFEIVLLILDWNHLKLIFNKERRLEIIAPGKPKWSNLMLLFALLAFASGMMLPSQVYLFMILGMAILIFCFIELAQIPDLFILDKIILSLYAFNITIIALAGYLKELLNLTVYQIYGAFGIVLAVAALLYLVRLIKYRKIAFEKA